MSEDAGLERDFDALRRELAAAGELVAQLRMLIASLEGRNAALQSTLVNHAHEIELLKRELYGPRSERSGTEPLGQMLLGDLLADRAVLQKKLDELRAADGAQAGKPQDANDEEPKKKERKKPTGRRDLSVSTLPQVVVDLTDPALAARGKLIDYEVSRQLAYRRGSFYVVVRRTAKYEVPAPEAKTVLSVPSPKTVLSTSILHTSLIAWIAVQKFVLGVSHYRLEQQLEAEGVPLARSVMSRNIEEIGSALGATVVHAMFEDARANCRVLSTDATGAAIQSDARHGGPKRPCKKGHFFTVVADRDHVLFEHERTQLGLRRPHVPRLQRLPPIGRKQRLRHPRPRATGLFDGSRR